MIRPRGTPGALVIGLGNPLMGDDGLGIAALELLRARWTFEPAVELVDGGTWGMNLLPLIETASRVLFLDAINLSVAPGQLLIVEGDQLPRALATKLSPHQIDLREVLAVAELRGTLPAEFVVLGLQPETIELHDGLSQPLRDNLSALLTATRARLSGWGHTAHRRDASVYA